MEIHEKNGLDHSMEQEEIHDEEAEGEAEEIDEAEAEEGEMDDGEVEEDETVLEEEEDDDEADEEGNLNGETSQGATSIGSHDSNDCSLMESSAAVSAQGNEEDNQSNPEDESSQNNRRKYKRKVWDPNAVREKLPRRAKDLRETDSDFVETPIAPVQVTTPRPGRPRGRGRGRKKQAVFELGLVESAVIPSFEGSPVPVQTPSRGRGRGRGRGSRGPRGGGSRGGGTAGRVAKVRTPRGGGRPRPPKFQVMDENARMSAENSFNGTFTGTPGGHGESSLNSSSSTKMKKLGTREIFDPSSQTPISAAQLIEYPWPHEDANAELWMVQEQVVNFLGLKGNFKRKYQDLKRRPVEAAERAWLLERKAVSETQANLGLTALQSRDVLDLFFNDFPDKYELYLAAQSEKKEQAYKSKGHKAAATPGAPAEKKPFDPRLRAIKAAAKWNTMFNKERIEERLTCIDLQTYTVHFPRRPTKLLQQSRMNVDPYPVAVIPGQFSSYYKPYSPYQLSCLPINTIMRNPLDGPPPEPVGRRKRRPTNASSTKGESIADSQTESDDSSSSSGDDSSSDSSDDSSSSSDDSDDSDDGRPSYQGQAGICKLCRGDKYRNKENRPEPLVHCAKCNADGHLTCWDLDVSMASQVSAYPWECNDCKTCDQCHDPADEEKMLFCDFCDRGYHIYCVGLRNIPEGRWHCPACARCGSCGTSGDKQWVHEYRVNGNGQRVYAVTLCGVCVQFWRQGNYCSLCNRCYKNVEEAGTLVNCRDCSKKAHQDCFARTKFKDFLCPTCTDKSRSRLLKK